ncbi:peptidase M20 [Syntrophotalea acetylenivorans]|uniref:Peptidase M20 n=1 Tax=Syntrophotalea acetylenivorans TaxID=1842532 RepID=A0A1L3GS53_9BACT|nr:M20/M25/M40 family metallo-hydrolase [Syntrophotalea acetylenivorans]APG28751.1 peptidase M20 [Syntrophotalea acetylenivorans]
MVNQQRIAAEFSRLAGISSPAFGEGEISRYLIKRLQELGATVVMDDAGEKIGSESGNLVATFPANGKDSEPLLVSVHMDTVGPAEGVQPVLNDGVFTSAGETILGADDKAGITEIIEALEVVREQNIPHGPVELVVAVCEEVGLLGVKHLDCSLVKSRRGVALDTSGTDWLINTAPGANKMRFEIVGRESHAGIAPEQGISAIAVAAKGVAAMRLGRIDHETTANIGTFNGGEATNIIPRKVVLEGEARSHDETKLAAQTEHMIACLEDAAREASCVIDGEQVDVTVSREVTADYPRMAVATDASIVQLAQQAAAGLDRTLEVRDGGGGSDANILNSYGIETVILGTGMCKVHSVDESVSVADMARVAELLVEIIRLA